MARGECGRLVPGALLATIESQEETECFLQTVPKGYPANGEILKTNSRPTGNLELNWVIRVGISNSHHRVPRMDLVLPADCATRSFLRSFRAR